MRDILYVMKLPRFIVGKNTTESNRNSLNVPPENVLSLRKKDDFKIEINLTHVKNFFSKNRKLVTPIGILVLVIIVFSIAMKGKANIVNFYPETCLGGWENPSNASGQPSVSSDAQGSDFTRDNSAFLRNRTAQMFCGDFGGEVPSDSVPRKFTVRFSWFVDDGSYDKGEKIINEALDEGRTIDTIIDTDTVETAEPQENSSNAESSLFENTETSTVQTQEDQVPSNEGNQSDLPSNDSNSSELVGDTPSDSSTADSPSQNDSSSDSSSADSGGSGDSSESTSDSGSGGSDSGGSDSSGSGESSSDGAGAFFEKFFTRVLAQESENPTSSIESQSEQVSESINEEKVENEVSESSEVSPQETKQDSESEVIPKENDVSESENSSESQDNQEFLGENDESENKILESNGIVSLDETARDDLFRVMYTLDGKTWEELGFIKRNNWKNVEFEIPFSSVDSWEKLSKVQIAVESLPTIDTFPETFLDSVWVSVEYEGVNPDPLPQPDFLTDKVLNDIRYENMRVIRIVKPDGDYQIWYAIVPPELMDVADETIHQDEVIKTGDSSLQVIDASTLSSYDPLLGPTLNDVKATEQINSNNDDASEKDTAVQDSDTKIDTTQPEVLGESISDDLVVSEATETSQVSDVKDTHSVASSIDAVFDLVTTVDSSDTKKNENIPKGEKEGQTTVLNEEIIKSEGESTDLQDLNQPEWYWNLIARGSEVHPEHEIAVDSFKVFWITATGDSMNMFGLDSSGAYSASYIDLSSKIGMMTFITPAGTPRFVRFNRETAQFIFADE